ncbi:MAG: pantetheine-phosphate adenylyltransferase [Thaumarchaeota archaeon]|nr:pantetheine-phosphate adenylyltransferase [Nitrososphaerota archaeon]MDE1832005.1 pantetheine-phosphate adenylyltransferase [Nitrososphaerota archaeon]MDE1840712.1 pantetheine-phosphate adenylyltransferase [Nitrososphaerota archaeon]MDE1878108.1 pantetheine-phosphate adenylyltransferase [Nitrososphaerota archaeon]
MTRFKLVALGGTFDIIHRGHLELLRNGFSISSKVIIGLTSDELARKKGKTPINDYSRRYKTLEDVIKKNFPNSKYVISKLDNDFGPAVLEQEVEALIVSEETSSKGKDLNKLRTERNSPPVVVIVVPMALAKDGTRISTTRIKNSEIDADGNILS